MHFCLRNKFSTVYSLFFRQHVRLAKKFERLVKSDQRFEVVNEVVMGLVCFRLKVRLIGLCHKIC